MDFQPTRANQTDEEDADDDRRAIAIAKLKSGARKPGGTFASMALARPILRAVERKGYKLATPIQRKCIPPIMEGRDVVAMARTGSGKSAAFLLPLIDRLKIRQPKTEIRALVLAPTRELASQTLKFARDFTKFTNLVTKLIVGGQPIAQDFETILSAPDILLATPGRLAHVLVEMRRKLTGLELVVFDEADRLFEPGFKELEQVNEICQRLPDSRQTLLFSATMPQQLAEFAQVGLRNPLFVRLDVEANLSETLKSQHLHCNQHDKFPILIHLLRRAHQADQMCAVFMPTRHHIEYAKMLLDNSRIPAAHVYSSMDPEARRINIDQFSAKKCRVLLVTDIAARGIDIPLLDTVINFNFPFKPKLFIHRVGRVARAGRSGCAISLVSHDETSYLHALHVFLGQPLKLASQLESQDATCDLASADNIPDKVLGSVPQSVCDNESEIIQRWHQHNIELESMLKVCDNAMKPYLKTREPAPAVSVKAAKDIHRKVIGIHPMFNEPGAQIDNTKSDSMLDRIKSYKPRATVFELGHKVPPEPTEESAKKKREKSVTKQPTSGEPKVREFQDKKFYLKYQPDDYAREKELNIKSATLDLIADENIKRKRWDRKRKNYVTTVTDEQRSKKIKTESGAYISASYRSGLFDKWKQSSKLDQRDDPADANDRPGLQRLRSKLKAPKRRGRELKNPEQIFKDREIREKRDQRLFGPKVKKQRDEQRKGYRPGQRQGQRQTQKDGTRARRRKG